MEKGVRRRKSNNISSSVSGQVINFYKNQNKKKSQDHVDN